MGCIGCMGSVDCVAGWGRGLLISGGQAGVGCVGCMGYGHCGAPTSSPLPCLSSRGCDSGWGGGPLNSGSLAGVGCMGCMDFGDCVAGWGRGLLDWGRQVEVGCGGCMGCMRLEGDSQSSAASCMGCLPPCLVSLVSSRVPPAPTPCSRPAACAVLSLFNLRLSAPPPRLLWAAGCPCTAPLHRL